MATSLGRVYLNGCNYELAYDLLGQSIDSNSSTVRLYGILHVTNNYISWSRGSASVHTSGLQGIGTYYSRGDYTVITRDFVFGHNNEGKFENVWIGASLSTTFVSGDTGGYLTLPTIPRQANLTNAPNFNDEQNPTINYSNPAGNSVNSLQARIENVAGNVAYIQYRDVNKTGNSYTFNFTNEERNILRNAIPNSSSLIVKFVLRTILGGNTYYSTIDRTMTIVNGNPTFEDFDYSTDLNNLTGNTETIINGKTTTTITIPSSKKAVGNKGASILRYSFECGNTSTLANYSDSDVSVLLTNCNSDIIRVTAIDSRGFETTVNKTVPNFKNYFSPTFVSQNVEREDGIEETVYLDTKFNFWNYNFGSVTNKINYLKYRAKESSSENFSNWHEINVSRLVINKEEATLNDVLIYLDGVSEGFAVGTTYDIQLQVIDEIDSVDSAIFSLYDGQVAFSVLRDSNGEYHIGINGMPDLNNTLKVHGTISNE